MCQLCFDLFPQDELNVTEAGHKEDVCKTCAEKEKGYGLTLDASPE
jgi:hypothetical protein